MKKFQQPWTLAITVAISLTVLSRGVSIWCPQYPVSCTFFRNRLYMVGESSVWANLPCGRSTRRSKAFGCLVA